MRMIPWVLTDAAPVQLAADNRIQYSPVLDCGSAGELPWQEGRRCVMEFLPSSDWAGADQEQLEYSDDGGTTWTSYFTADEITAIAQSLPFRKEIVLGNQVRARVRRAVAATAITGTMRVFLYNDEN